MTVLSGFILAVIVLFPTFKLSHCDRTLTILHTNLLRSHFEGKGKDNKTRGGIARIIQYVNEKKSQNKPTLYFDTMDWFTGSVWYSVHKMKICTDFMKILPVDALGLGEGEMYEGDSKTRERNFWEYINSICDKTILCANCEITSTFEGSICIKKSKVFAMENMKVGVTAYIQRSVVPPKFFQIQFTDESKAVNKEIEHFAEDGINITIVIGHGFYNFNAEMVKRLRGVDLLIGGHAPRLSYNGKPPKGVRTGPYPETAQDANGEDVFLVYTGEFGQYVGNIALTFDKDGRVTKFAGNPKYMGSSVPEDPTALEILEGFRPDVEKYATQVVGKSRVLVDVNCDKRECNLGNLLMDAYIYHRANQWADLRGRYWTDAAIAFVNTGNVRKPLGVENKTIVMAELMESVPFNNALFAVTMNGSMLRRAFEHSGARMERKGQARFLQVAGLHVIYDPNREPMDRVISLRARCASCKTPLYADVKDKKIYKAITNEFLTEGGDGYEFGDAKLEQIHGGSEVDVLKKYIEYCRTVQIGNEERILVRRRIKQTKSGSSEYVKENVSGHLLLFTYILYLYIIFDHVFATTSISLSLRSKNLHF